MQARIEPLPNPPIKLELKYEHAIYTLKVKMKRKSIPSASETYNMNISMFNDGQPDEFLALLNNFKIEIDGTGTTSPSGRITCLRNMLCGQALRDFDELISQNNGLTKNHLKIITEVLLGYFFPINALSKQKHATRRAIFKTQSMMFKVFDAQLT